MSGRKLDISEPELQRKKYKPTHIHSKPCPKSDHCLALNWILSTLDYRYENSNQQTSIKSTNLNRPLSKPKLVILHTTLIKSGHKQIKHALFRTNDQNPTLK